MTTRIVEFQGKEYEFDWAVTLSQAMEIKDATGWGIRQFDRMVDEWDPLAIKWHWWLLNRKNGVTIDVARIPDDWPASEYMNVIQEATVRRSAEVYAAQQRSEAGKTPKGSKRGIPSSSSAKKAAGTRISDRSTKRTSTASPTSAT
jgi:hypothetical protein